MGIGRLNDQNKHTQMSIKERIKRLRAWMSDNNLQAFIVPSNDPHYSEYVADHWKTREWISGFTGSAGVVIITENHAGLWTDSRYFIQAEEELKQGGISLHRSSGDIEADYINWLKESLNEFDKVGVDRTLFSIEQVRRLRQTITASKSEVVLSADPFDIIWYDRPSLPVRPVFEADASKTGADRQERIKAVQSVLTSKGCTHLLVTALDEIGWLLNLRGRDVECNPVFIGYAIVAVEGVHLFADLKKFDGDLQSKLMTAGVQIRPYDHLTHYLQEIEESSTILIDPNKTSQFLFDSLGAASYLETHSPIVRMKAIKNETEQACLREVMVKDGVALVKAFMWIEHQIQQQLPVTEAEFADKIAACRSEQAGYFGESFHAIVGYKGNGAIVHYRPLHGQSAAIEGEGVLLVDSGGQYEDGTTDITRTFYIGGEPDQEVKEDYTAVLKGHIALAKAVFPEGTKGVQLDILARQYLWASHKNYGHGTGHGVGFFMNVHEPPQGFVTGLNERGTTPHEPGMYSSNEPGFYKEKAYGIRIENLVICQRVGQSPYGNFNDFETITLFPIAKNLIDKNLMSDSECQWLNDYHSLVFDKLSVHLNPEERKWLENKCSSL